MPANTEVVDTHSLGRREQGAAHGGSGCTRPHGTGPGLPGTQAAQHAGSSSGDAQRKSIRTIKLSIFLVEILSQVAPQKGC